MSYAIIEQGADGTKKEFVFSDVESMTKALQPIFADSVKTQQQRDRDDLNKAIRAQVRSRTFTVE